MSILNDDKKTLDQRKNALKDIDVSLRDQVVKKLYDKVEELEVGRKVTASWELATTNISAALKRQQVFLQDLDEHLPTDANGAFAGSSNLHIPMPFIVAKTYHARFVAALMDVDPPFSIKARREDGTDRVQMVEDLMKYTLSTWCNHYHGIRATVDDWVWDWVTTGTGIMKIRWERQYCRFIDVEPSMEAGMPKVMTDPNTGEQVLVPTQRMVEKEVARTIKKFDGPVFEPVLLEDFRMVGSQDPDTADMVMQRTWLSASDLWQNVDQKLFDEEAVKKTIASGKTMKSSSSDSSIKSQRAANSGKASVDSETEADRYEIIEAYLKLDVDESGIVSDVIVWVHKESREILRATYLYRVIPSGERPFSVSHFHKRRGQELGVGLLEILHPLSVELDAHHNMRIDFGLISNNPVGFYRAASGLDPQTIQMEPGMLLPLDNPQTDVYFPPRPNSTAFGAQEEAMVQSYVERLTGISDLSLGVQNGSQGASRTASGVRALIGESNSNLNIHLGRLNAGWTKALRTAWHMIQVRIEPGFAFRVTGDTGQDYFYTLKNPSYELALDVDFEVSSNTANSNKQVQIETAQQIVQTASNPLYIQTGITTQANIYNALKNYFSCIGVKDMHRYISKPQGETYLIQPIDEFNRIIRGMDVPVGPQGDHDAFLAFGEHILQAQQQVPTLTDDQVHTLIAQMKKHEAVKQAMDQQAAQQAVAQQMQANAAQSQQQAPAALNPLAGTQPGQLPGG